MTRWRRTASCGGGRALRQVRSLRKIIHALTKSLIPVSNVFLIMFLLISFGPPPPMFVHTRAPAVEASPRAQPLCVMKDTELEKL